MKVGITFDYARKAYRESLQEWESKIEKITDLFMCLDTNQSELVATVLFTANSLINSSKEKHTEIDILREVMKWKQKRQSPLNEAEVAYTIRNLAAL
ncbi:MAG: Appr-1-p processing protein, partial [bacterium]